MHLDKGCMEIINAHCHDETLRDQNSEHGNAEEQVWTPAPIDLGAAGLCYHGKSAAVPGIVLEQNCSEQANS